MSVRRAVMVTLFATAIVGGTAAAAEVFAGTIEDPIVDETPTTLAPDVTTTTAPGDEGEVPDGEGETPDEATEEAIARWYEGCGHFTEGNHGDYVREAAQAEDKTGASVSEAAKSPCGKPVSSVHTEPTIEEPVEEPVPDSGSTLQGQSQGQGQGQSHGKSGEPHGKSASAPGRNK